MMEPDVENMGEMMREYRLGQHSPTDKDRQGKSRTYADFDMDTQSQRPRYYDDYLWFSIFSMLCCCCCIGIAAVWKSCHAKQAGDRLDPVARRHSNSALLLNKIALGVGICMHIVWIATVVGLVLAGVTIFQGLEQKTAPTYDENEFVTMKIYGTITPHFQWFLPDS